MRYPTRTTQGRLSVIIFAFTLITTLAIGTNTTAAAPTAAATANVTIGPVPLSVDFDGSQSTVDPTGTLSVEWNFGDGSPPSTEVSPSHVYLFLGIFAAELQVFDGLGQSDVDTITITVTHPGNSPPVANAGQDQNIYPDGVALLDGSGTDPDGASIVDYLWTIESTPLGSSAYVQEPAQPDTQFVPDLVGEYVLSLIVSDGTDWGEKDCVTINVTENLLPVAVATVDYISGPAPLTVTFSGSGSYDPEGNDLAEYKWTFPGSAEPDPFYQVSVTLTFNEQGSYLGILEVTDDAMQSNETTITITVTDSIPSIPTFTEWGMIIFFILLVGSGLWVIRRRKNAKSK